MTIHFPDISHYQGNINLVGAQAVIAKATQGTNYRDPEYVHNKAKTQMIAAPFAAYHWIDESDPTRQCAHAFDVVGPKIPLMWDAEAAGATVPRIVGMTNTYRNMGGRVPLVYFPRWWWSQLGHPDLTPLAAAGLALVSSNYPINGYTGDNGVGWNPYGGVAPTIWQYTNHHPWKGQGIDFNAYRGTIDQLWSLLYGTNPTPQPEEPDVLTPIQEAHFEALVWRVEAIFNNRPEVAGGPHKGTPEGVNQLRVALDALEDRDITLEPEQLVALVTQVAAAAASGIDGVVLRKP